MDATNSQNSPYISVWPLDILILILSGMFGYLFLEQAAVLILFFKLARHKYLVFHFNNQKTRRLVSRGPRLNPISTSLSDETKLWHLLLRGFNPETLPVEPLGALVHKTTLQ